MAQVWNRWFVFQFLLLDSRLQTGSINKAQVALRNTFARCFLQVPPIDGPKVYISKG